MPGPRRNPGAALSSTESQSGQKRARGGVLNVLVVVYTLLRVSYQTTEPQKMDLLHSQYQALLEISEAIASHREIDPLFHDLAPRLHRVLEFDFANLILYEPGHQAMKSHVLETPLVAATNADLAQKVGEDQFRSDLYYRLNVFPVVIPPLRDRREDIPLLACYFAQKHARRMKKPIGSIAAKAMTALTEYHWPGNVRELENFIERGVILSRGGELQISLAELKQRTKVAPLAPLDGFATLANAEREHIVRVLSETNWVIGGPTGAAARLGIKRTTLQSRMIKLGITRPN